MALILASASPRRQELLRLLTQDFEVLPSSAEEEMDTSLPVPELVQRLSYCKAQAIAVKQPDDIVIGADTVVALEGEVLGKPKDLADARRMLNCLSGKTHTVYTGVTILKRDKCRQFAESTKVSFYRLREQDISWYLSSGEPFDKAGAYGIQEKGSLLVKGIVGDYFNVMGLPVARLCRALEDFY